MSTDHDGPTVTNWRALHSYVVDAILVQHEDNRAALLHLMGGLSLEAFMNSIYTGFARIRSVIEDDVLKYLVEVHSDLGWAVLVRPPAEVLGIKDTPELRDEEIALHARHMLRDLGIEDT